LSSWEWNISKDGDFSTTLDNLFHGLTTITPKKKPKTSNHLCSNEIICISLCTSCLFTEYY